MQRVTVLCVGKLKEKFYIDAAAEYVKRLQRHCKLEPIELPEQRLPDDPSPAEIQRPSAPRAMPSAKSCPRAARSSPCASRASPAPARN